MIETLIKDSSLIIKTAIAEVMPQKAVAKALADIEKPIGKTIIIAIGKAAYDMAKKASEIIDYDKGLIVTKYKHSKGDIKNFTIIEAGHPILDQNSIIAGKEAIKMVNDLSTDDLVLFLISGGGSALFEVPLLELNEFQDINDQLLKCGATIEEINTVRKRLSQVKGGRFAEYCKPAKVINIILSDIIGDPLDMIASGPTVNDRSSSDQALSIIKKYKLNLSAKAQELMHHDCPHDLNNVTSKVTGNNYGLRKAAINRCKELGYKIIEIKEPLCGDIKETENLLCDYLKENYDEKTAIIASGEITVEIKGKGLGGRNQELALRLGKHLKDNDSLVFCIGSDGTDGPTDAAGAYCILDNIKEDINDYLSNNDAYHYFEKYGGLIKTGPTGTNVCDLYCILKN